MAAALMLINSAADFETEVLNHIEKIPGLDFVKRVYGSYNLVVKISAPSDEELKKLILEIRNHQFVKSSSTLLIREVR